MADGFFLLFFYTEFVVRDDSHKDKFSISSCEPETRRTEKRMSLGILQMCIRYASEHVNKAAHVATALKR